MVDYTQFDYSNLPPQPKSSVGPKISGPRRFVRTLNQPRSIPGASKAYKALTKPRSIPGTGNLKSIARKVAAPAYLADLAYDASQGFGNQENRSVQDIQNRGGFLASSMKDAFPRLSKLGTAIGEGIGELVYGPIPATNTPINENAAQGQVPQPTTQSYPQTLPPQVDLPAQDQLGNYIAAASTPQAPTEPAAPTPPVNNSYFINNQTGAAPGQKQYFRDLPFHDQFQNQPAAPTAPAAPTSAPTPLADAFANLDLPQINSGDSLGTLFAKRGQLNNARLSLLPAIARQSAINREQEQGNTDRQFGLDQATNLATIAQNAQQLADTRQGNNLDRLARLRGQNITARSRASGATPAPASYSDQVKQFDALDTLASRMFADAPAEFASAVPNLVQQGIPLDQVQNAYNQVISEQAAATGVSPADLDPQKLYDAVSMRLGITR